MDEYLRDILNGPNGPFAALLLGVDAEEDEDGDDDDEEDD